MSALEQYVPSVAHGASGGFRLRPFERDKKHLHAKSGGLELLPTVTSALSIGPTPSAASTLGHAGRQTIKPGQILLPSWGRANDHTRLHACGQHLPKDALEDRVTTLSLSGSLSAPSLLSDTLPGASTSPRWPMSQTKRLPTPRQLRKTVRSASTVGLEYDPKDIPRMPPKFIPELPTKPPPPSHFVKGPVERVKLWTDELRSVAGIRKDNLIAQLFMVRRSAEVPGSPGRPDSQGSDAPAEGQGPDELGELDEGGKEKERLLFIMLKDLEDDYDTLQVYDEQMQSTADPCPDFGGVRHPSLLMHMRTLRAVQRKRGLLWDVEERTRQFAETQKRQNEFIKGIIANTCGIPEVLQKIPAFLKSKVHSPGEPIDADRSYFESFVTSFGLPSHHVKVLTLRDLNTEATDSWAKQVLAEAKTIYGDGTGSGDAASDAGSIKRMIQATLTMCPNPAKKQPDEILEADQIRTDLLAQNVLKVAEKQKVRDAGLVASNTAPQPESAKRAADTIDEELTIAKGEGVDPQHKDMAAAKMIAVEMRRAEKDRVALKGLRYAEAAQAKDAAVEAKLKEGEIMPPGPAEQVAQQIEREIESLIEREGGPRGHEFFQQAQDIAKAMRDLDNTRKRMAARAKRLADQAAAKAAAK
jgi:hypothetical protein